MNTSKQINVIIGLMFATFVVLAGYLFNESNRLEVETEEITERNAERGARLFVNNCRACHGLEGEGFIGPPLDRDAFLILGEGNVLGVEETSGGEAANVRTYLRDTISCGRVGTAMPRWAQRFGGPLSDTQVEHLVTLITNDPTGKEDYWDLVREEGEHADEEQFAASLEKELGRHPTAEEIHAHSAERTLVDPGALSVTQNVCGQFTAKAKAQAQSRDPFAAGLPAMATPTGTATAVATLLPVGDGEQVEVELSEFAIAVDPVGLSRGTIGFSVANAGGVFHNLRVIRSDAAPDALPVEAGQVPEGQVDVVGRVDDFAGGGSESITLNLEPGSYLLICNIAGHYQLGMTAAFTVQ